MVTPTIFIEDRVGLDDGCPARLTIDVGWDPGFRRDPTLAGGNLCRGNDTRAKVQRVDLRKVLGQDLVRGEAGLLSRWFLLDENVIVRLLKRTTV